MKRSIVLCALAWLLCGAVRVQAAIDAYLFLDGIPGESTAAGFVDQIVIDSFSMGVANAGGARAQLSDLNLMHALDKASPLLMLKCAQGATIPSAVLTVRTITSSGKPVPFYVIRLTNVKVTSVQVSGATGGAARPSESFSLNYETIEWEYTPITPTGSTLPVVTTRWNLAPVP